MPKQTKKIKGTCAIKNEAPKYERKWGNQFAKHYDDKTIEQIADQMWEWFQAKENFWLKDFAIANMIHKNRIAEFAEKNEYFKWIYEMCKDAQESKAIRLGLNKKFNPAMPILILKNNHKWSDKLEFKDETPIKDKVLRVEFV